MVALICVASFGFYAWSQRYIKAKVAEANKVNEYKKLNSAWRGIVFPISGVLLIAYSLFNWDRMPPENAPIGYLFIGFGVLAILYGAYCSRKKSRTSQD